MRRIVFLFLLLTPFLLSGCALDTLLPKLANQAPEAVIDASIQQGPAPLTAQFNAGYSYDDGTITEYSWDFGDPQDATLMSTVTATHTYTVPGLYRVKLIVTDDKGKINSEDIAITVTNPPPLASFTMSSDAPAIGDEVTFNAAGSYDTNGEIASYTWDLGDGTTASGVTVIHTYAEEGAVTVILTVTDNEGKTTIAKHDLIVQESDGGCSGGSCGGPDIPLAVITGLPSCAGGTAGVAVTLDGSYSRAADGTIVKYAWEFGDGETGSGAQVSHIYKQTGRFVVTLTVTDDSGAKGIAYGVVDIN
ncbi:MAG: PKD domain-containing protein, partial [Candidatus Bipolaricaulota bacterium]|nr:PKD domain-containing protein [Candidatus Bipolaricaulota bacterium]